MDHKKAQRFLEAAQADYNHAIFWYVATTGSKSDGPESIDRARRGVLEAKQILDLAQQEVGDVERHLQAGKDYTGICDECGRTAPRWVAGSGVDLRALCAECGKDAQ